VSKEQALNGYWAITTRGLEHVVRAELEQLISNNLVCEVGYRRVTFTTDVPAGELLELRTADDLFIDLGTWKQMDHRRFALGVLGDRARELDLRDAAALCRELRDVGAPPRFSVTVNFVGRRNYSTDEIKTAISSGIEDSHGWPYVARDTDADLNVRIFLEHQQAHLGLRLGHAPLHERAYKVANIAGSLKPPVAAAMIRLGRFSPGARLLDPLCGAGTIPLEAAAAGYIAVGGDHSPDAITAARANQATLAAGVDVRVWDARALPLGDASVDGVVCNLPWGRQVALETPIDRFYSACITEMARVTVPNGRLVLLTNLRDLLLARAEEMQLRLVEETEISLSGQTPAIFVLQKHAE
jgi:tRNA (guanine6-N2)-methyltransferase